MPKGVRGMTGVGLKRCGDGVWCVAGDSDVRIIDRSGTKKLPIGRDGFVPAMEQSVLVDKSMLIADVLDNGYAVTLFCRPRRFGKTLNMTMLKAFFEISPDSGAATSAEEGDTGNKIHGLASLFEGTRIWDAGDGRYRRYQGAYPVVYVSMCTAKKSTWDATYGALRNLIGDEYARHEYLADSAELDEDARALFRRIKSGVASDAEFADSLMTLCRMLARHHHTGVVMLIDEYDAPVMAGYSAPDGGYYRDVVDFLKGWLTGALKDGGEFLQFACLTGVQRISKESIFSDLNNLRVSTPLSTISDERFGFTDAEVAALAAYKGLPDCMGEARQWYDGYRFGNVSVYNPWSVLNYLDQDYTPGVYWANTSSNEVIGELIRHADADTLARIYGLLEPGGYVAAPLDLGVVFPDVGVRQDAIWSMLYLAGYLTTDLTMESDNNRARRPLRIPNREIAQLFRGEIIDRFTVAAGGDNRLDMFHRALCTGDAERLESELRRMATGSASSYDLISENSCHLFLLGLCFGIPGYADPTSNREAWYGRFDIQLEPVRVVPGSLAAFGALPERPLITIELKYLPKSKAAEDSTELDAQLHELARTAMQQIDERGYDQGDLLDAATGRLRYGIAFSGKHVHVVGERMAL